MDFKDIAIKVIDNAELKKALMNYLEFCTPNKNDSVLVPYENLIMFQASESVHPIGKLAIRLVSLGRGILRMLIYSLLAKL